MRHRMLRQHEPQAQPVFETDAADEYPSGYVRDAIAEFIRRPAIERVSAWSAPTRIWSRVAVRKD